ncbi:MAG: right-handed parallel beta-helix repeat-containing protein [Bacteroidia bacterium]|nr:right-handed parallel beta-helix repeat-containing protein [Bacteroidia bacterium]MDW8088723.1 right-handed parallel beta-helix repeat-containing protein [Bacteroidia bacterium]
MRNFALGATLVGLVIAQRTWYFSSSQGHDAQDGRVPQRPLRSLELLQRLLSGQVVAGQRLSRGDTIAFLRGDTFRVVRVEGGTLRYGLALNGPVFRQPGPPIVFTAYGPTSAPLPLFTGTWRLSDSAQAIISSGPLIKVAKPFGTQDSLVPLRVFWRGQPLRPARFPNDSLLIIQQSLFNRATDPDTLVSAGLQNVPAAFVAGARVWASLGSDYSWGCNKAQSLVNNQLIVLPWGPFTPLRGARFFLEGKPEFIDQPGEWAYDEQGDTLYLFPPQLPFNPTEYELMVVRMRPTDRHVQEPKAFTLTASYDTLPADPIQAVQIENLHFFALGEGIRTAGVSNVVLRRNRFSHSYRPIWNFLADRLYIQENEFFDNEDGCIIIYGRTVPGRQGHPRAMTRRVYVERNLIKRTGLQPRWSWQALRVDSARFVREDYSIVVGYNIDSVIVRYNRIDSVSQGAIGGNCFYYTQADWNNTYAGTIPFIVEKNYITNFCMDFSDCGGIKFISFMKDGIVRDNILIKGANRDKSHLAWPVRPFAKGLYSDVSPHDIIWEGNTVIGASLGCGNFFGGGPIRRIRVRRNTFYNCQRLGIDVVPEWGGAEGCEVVGNIFFLGMHEGGAVNFYDAGGNNRRDSFTTVDENRYGHPTYAISYVYRAENGSVTALSLRQMQAQTPYERSPLSKWLHWVGFRAWDSAQVRRQLVSNPSLDPAQPLPISAFGQARLRRVESSPFGGPAYLVWYPDTAPAGVWSGVGMRLNEAVYTTTLDSSQLYRWSIYWAANRSKDFYATVGWPRYRHPNTGDTLSTTDRFALPVFRPYTPETLQVRYKPRFQQFWTNPTIALERGDSVWFGYWNFEEITPNSVPSLEEVYPIFINPSDETAEFPLPPGWIYLTLDSTAVWGKVRVQPWRSRILVRLRYESALVNPSDEIFVSTWALAFPNPTPGRLKVLIPEPAEYFLYNTQGQLLDRGRWIEEGELDLTGWASGLYLLRLSYQSGHQEVVRLMRE